MATPAFFCCSFVFFVIETDIKLTNQLPILIDTIEQSENQLATTTGGHTPHPPTPTPPRPAPLFSLNSPAAWRTTRGASRHSPRPFASGTRAHVMCGYGGTARRPHHGRAKHGGLVRLSRSVGVEKGGVGGGLDRGGAPSPRRHNVPFPCPHWPAGHSLRPPRLMTVLPGRARERTSRAPRHY